VTSPVPQLGWIASPCSPSCIRRSASPTAVSISSVETLP
jgi:hypothetical protein